MNLLERKIVDALIELKEIYNVVSLKAEFESEGCSIEELLRLKDFAVKSGLQLTLKIGGCEAMRDLMDARNIGVDNIVAPLVESAFAMKKFVKALKSVYSQDELQELNSYINIESLNGLKSIDEIIETSEFDQISGVVFGRGDFTESIMLSRKDINSDEILNAANNLISKLPGDKEFVLGGGISIESIPFLSKINHKNVTKFETRKIIFDYQNYLKKSDTKLGINKALDLEILWHKYLEDIYMKFANRNVERVNLIKSRSSVSDKL